MPSYRINRINEDVKREMTDILRTVKDPRVPELTTVVRCDVSGDLSCAKIYISTINGGETTVSAVKGLVSASGFIRHELGERLKLRKIPELKFIADTSIEHGIKIARMLEDIDND